MDFLLDIGSFGAKVIILTVALGVIVILISGMFRRREPEMGEITVELLDEQYRSMGNSLKRAVLSKKELKEEDKKEQEREKGKDTKQRVFVLDFLGDMDATMVQDLREQITALLQVATPEDEVVMTLESEGGVYSNYGLAASQLERLRQRKIPITICIDKVAASGGYMMACLADKILAAPFAMIGSIGVIVSVPNANRLLKKLDLDYLELTAGEYKRTLTTFGEVTEKGKNKVLEELEDSHNLFKEHILRFRSQVKIEKVATGEVWFGSRALELNLIDELCTSDDYLFNKVDSAQIFKVNYSGQRSLRERMVSTFAEAGDKLLVRWWARLHKTRIQ